MASRSPQTALEQLERGWELLADGRWEAARSAFEEALEVKPTAEAEEGRSWAAWWLDDADAVFASRERAYRLYRSRGENAAAGRMATWLAVDELDFHGAAAVASGWLQRARRLLEPLEPGPDHGWLAFHEGYLANADGDADAACEHAAVAADLGRRFGVADLEMLGLALEGSALVSCADVERGMRRLDEATATAMEGEATIPISSAWTCCLLVSACTAVLDLDRAVQWCDRIAELADRYGTRYMLGFCRAEYGQVHLWRGRWPQAEAMLEASVDDFSRSRPAWVAAPLVTLAELRRRQGRPAEAERLLTRAGSSGAAQVCRARLALDRGEPRQAGELLDRVLRQTPPQRRLDRAPALALLVECSIARGEPGEAASAVAALRETAQLVGTALLRAVADLAEGRLLAAVGDPGRARPLLEDAVDRFARTGAPLEEAQARLELAAALSALGRGDAASSEAATARDRLLTLGAEAELPKARQLTSADRPLPELTDRERDVLRLLAEGLTNRQIAGRLVVSEHTVHRHVTNILRKLDLPSRTAAAAQAVRAGVARGPGR